MKTLGELIWDENPEIFGADGIEKLFEIHKRVKIRMSYSFFVTKFIGKLTSWVNWQFIADIEFLEVYPCTCAFFIPHIRQTPLK